MVASIDMEPRKESAGRTFLKSQFRTKIPEFPKNKDLSGQVAIVTGSTTGIGLHCARQLLSLGLTRLIIAVRSTSKGEATASKFRSQFPKAQIDVWPLEMTSYESIQAFARRASSDLQRLDMAILNAGMLTTEFSLVPGTGHEVMVQVNYLSTFLLAILLLPVLKAKKTAGPGRLTIVNSGTALGAKLKNYSQTPLLPSFDSKDFWDSPLSRYPDSKLLGHLALVKLVEFVSPQDVVVNLVDPGLVKGTGLHRDIHNGILSFLMGTVKQFTGRTLEQGAHTYVDAAVVKGGESHGCYVMDWEIRPYVSVFVLLQSGLLVVIPSLTLKTHRFAPFVYTAEGKDTMNRLWEETLAEFQFANLRQILEEMRTS